MYIYCSFTIYIYISVDCLVSTVSAFDAASFSISSSLADFFEGGSERVSDIESSKTRFLPLLPSSDLAINNQYLSRISKHSLTG